MEDTTGLNIKLKEAHNTNNYGKLSDTDKETLTSFGQSSGKKGDREYPQRALIKKIF